MKKLLLSGLMALGVSGMALADGDAAAGQTKAAMCGACHGMDGNSPAPTFPKLAGQNARYLLKQMQDIKSGSRTVAMMAGQLDSTSDQDMADIAAYFASQTISPGAGNEALLAKGESVYRAGIKDRGLAACTGCHSPDGLGNAAAGYPSLAGQHAAYIATQLKAFRLGAEDESAGRHNDGEIRIMREIAFRLSDKEIEAVADFISSLK